MICFSWQYVDEFKGKGQSEVRTSVCEHI